MKRLRTGLLALVCIGSTAGATIYKYVDADGNVTYSDVEAKGARPVDMGDTGKAPPGRPAPATAPVSPRPSTGLPNPPGEKLSGRPAPPLFRQTVILPSREAVPDLRCAADPRIRRSVPAPDASSALPGVPDVVRSADTAPASQSLPPLALRVTDGQGTRPLRIAVWGDSHMAGGSFVAELGRAIEGRGLRVERTMVPVGLVQSGAPRPIRRVCAASTDWTLAQAYRAPQPIPVGPSLVTLQSTHTGSRIALDVRDRNGARVYDRLSVRYTPQQSGAVVAVSVDDGEERILLLQAVGAGNIDVAELAIEGTGLLSVVRLRVVEGVLSVQALQVSPVDPAAVTLDVFGLDSSTARGWSQADPGALRAALADTGYDLVMLAYGTNEGAAPQFQRDTYASDLRKALAAMRRVFPSQDCILVGPPDRGYVPEKRVSGGRKDPMVFALRHQQIAEVQADMAKDFNCSFWNWQAAMGGPGSSYRWAEAQPPLMQRDLTHLTADGYRRSAGAFADALGLGAGPKH